VNGGTTPADERNLDHFNVQPLQGDVVGVTVVQLRRRVTSSNATFTVLLPAYISRQPANVMVRVAPDPQAAPSPTATFNLSALSTTPLRYQWRFNGATSRTHQHHTHVHDVQIATRAPTQ